MGQCAAEFKLLECVGLAGSLAAEVHKRAISYCVRHPDGTILQEGSVPALPEKLDELVAKGWLVRLVDCTESGQNDTQEQPFYGPTSRPAFARSA